MTDVVKEVKMEKRCGFDDVERPKGPFLYVSGRPYLPLEPKRERLPYALTEVRGEEIRRRMGCPVEVRFDASPRIIPGEMTKEFYSHFISFVGSLEEAVRIPVYTEGLSDPMYTVWDWVYRLRIDAPSDAVEQLRARQDAYVRGDHAFEHATMHWGTERWSGLTLEILSDGEQLIRTDVDVFGPGCRDADPLVPKLIVGMYSHVAEKLRALRKEG